MTSISKKNEDMKKTPVRSTRMKIFAVIYVIVTVTRVHVDCVQFRDHCLIYKWRDMLKTDCVNKNLFNTFVDFFHETQVLDLSYNVITILHGNEFQDANLRRIKELSISHNRLHRIDKLTFNGLEHLEYVDLSYNSIEYIPPTIFDGNPNLRVFNISNNPLSLNKDDTFLSKVPSLLVLNMAHCNLESIGDRLFLNLGKLQILNVSDNSIQTIRPEALEPMNDLKYLDVSGNNLICNDKSTMLVKWLNDRNIHFQPFCGEKSQKLLTVTVFETNDIDHFGETFQRKFNKTQNKTRGVKQHQNNPFDKVVQLFQSIPLFYVVLGLKVGIVIGGFSTYFCLRRIVGRPSVPQRNRNRNRNEGETLRETTSHFNNNDAQDISLIPLNTPPETPPPPYRSRLFPSNFSLSTA